MSPVGLALVWSGYTLAYFGWCSLRGAGVGLFDLIIPGREVTIPGGNPAGPSSSSGSGFGGGGPAAGTPKGAGGAPGPPAAGGGGGGGGGGSF